MLRIVRPSVSVDSRFDRRLPPFGAEGAFSGTPRRCTNASLPWTVLSSFSSSFFSLKTPASKQLSQQSLCSRPPLNMDIFVACLPSKGVSRLELFDPFTL